MTELIRKEDVDKIKETAIEIYECKLEPDKVLILSQKLIEEINNLPTVEVPEFKVGDRFTIGDIIYKLTEINEQGFLLESATGKRLITEQALKELKK